MFHNFIATGLMRVGSVAFAGASLLLSPSALLASTYDGQAVHIDSGEAVQVNCAPGAESSAQLTQFGNTRYYSLRCVGGSTSANAPAPPVVETTSSGAVVHLDGSSSVHIVCYGGSANLNTAGNTRYYALNCN